MMSNEPDLQAIDKELRKRVMSFCAPIWWESGGQTIIDNGSMCVVKTAHALFGITNRHVLRTYEKQKAEDADIVCQLGSTAFDPTANLIDSSQYWDLATFKVPDEAVRHFGHRVFLAREWPPQPLKTTEHAVYGGYPEDRRTVPPGKNPREMTAQFVSFRAWPHGSSAEQVSFQIRKEELTWLENVEKPLDDSSSLSGISGGPCFRIIPAENRIELAAVIYEGRWDIGVVFARQLQLINASGRVAPMPPGVNLPPGDDA
jgi:hypothetical protein